MIKKPYKGNLPVFVPFSLLLSENFQTKIESPMSKTPDLILQDRYTKRLQNTPPDR